MSTVSNISSGIQNLQWEVVTYPHGELDLSESRQDLNSAQPINSIDSVHVSSGAPAYAHEPTLLQDEDVDGVMQDTMHLITEDPYAALHVHEGLDASRVAALLA